MELIPDPKQKSRLRDLCKNEGFRELIFHLETGRKQARQFY